MTETNASTVSSLFQRPLIADPHFGLYNINVIGDSISHGANVADISNHAWTGLMRKVLQAQYNTRNYGYVSLMGTLSNAVGRYEDMHTIDETGTWTHVSDDTVIGLYRRTASETGAKLRVRPKYKSRCMRLHYLAWSGGGTFTVSIQGQAAATVNTYAAATRKDSVSPVIDLSELPDGGYFEIENISGEITLNGVYYYDQADEMVFNNYARSGAALRNISDEIIDILSQTNIAFFALGHNDEWGEEVSTFTPKLNRFISNFKQYHTFVVVLDFIWRQPPTNAFRMELRRLASETNGVYIAFDEIWGNDTDVMEANGYLSDNSHPTELGSRVIFEKTAQTLGLA